MMHGDFDHTTYLSQVRRLRTLAEDTLKLYPIKYSELKFINHGENTTYKVITKKKNYLLRIHCRSHRTKNAFLEELKWLDQLSKRTRIPVQKPLRSKKGELIVSVYNDQVGHARYCDLLEWQEGHMKNKKSTPVFFEVGKLIGKLQKNSMSSRHRLYWDSKGLIGKRATLGGLPDLAQDFPRHTKEIERLRSYLYKKIAAYEKKNRHKMSMIHADLHFGNMIWNKNVVQPIDFDDCGYGLELYDLGVTLAQSSNYFKSVGKKQAASCKEALVQGYCLHKELTDEDYATIPYFVAVRELAMLGWLYNRRDNPELARHLRKSISTRIKKTRQYIELADKQRYFS